MIISVMIIVTIMILIIRIHNNTHIDKQIITNINKGGHGIPDHL